MSEEEDFFRTEPSPQAAWRWIVLMGRNSRTYKFPLAAALLEHAATGREDVPLAELAATYAMNIVRRVKDAPQASENTSASATDFLTVAKDEADESLRLGQPTERLLRAAIDNMPQMVMRMFHHVHGGDSPYRFYDIRGRGPGRFVWLSQELRQIAMSSQAVLLQGELDARWSIVETSFMSGVGRSLLQHGVAVDLQHGVIMDRFSVRRAWPELDLDTIWNLAPAHYACNADKSDRPPGHLELERLARRNEAIMFSPHPLKKTLEVTLANGTRSFIGGKAWPDFILAVQQFFLA